MDENYKKEKMAIGILGATGMVGQQYIKLLRNHPWFKIAYVAASPQTVGQKYKDAIGNFWHMDIGIPKMVGNLVLEDVNDVRKAEGKCALVFSAFEMPDKQRIRDVENQYAEGGIPVISSSAAHRHTDDVPMLIPEVNPGHLAMIPIQKKHHGWDKGFVITKPNCSLQSYVMPIHALIEAGFSVKNVFVATLQAVSGAGYPGVPSFDMVDNVIPFIGGEEEKTEQEPLKILGSIENERFVPEPNIQISAHCNRVPVVDGHLACVSVLFTDKKPAKEEILKIWKDFRSAPQELDLPFAPKQPILYRDEENRPQPRKDRDVDKSMAIVVGRLRECNLFDYKFVALSHNTVRGAAGGGILSAELLVEKGYIV